MTLRRAWLRSERVQHPWHDLGSTNRASAAARRVRRPARRGRVLRRDCRSARRSTRSLNYERIADDVDSVHRQARIRQHDDPRPVPAAVEHRRRAPALAVPDGPQRSSAPGEDDALLAQPLRDRLREDRRHVRRRRRRRATWRRSRRRIRAGVRGQIEMLRDNALGNFRDILVNIAKDMAMLVWLDGRTNTQGQAAGELRREIMELFTMGVGNFTEDDVYAAARVFTGWNLTRPGVAADGVAALRVRLQRGPARHRGEDLQLSRSTPTAARRFRRGRPPTGCRTASISSTRWPPARTRRAIWRRSCIASSSRSSATSTTPFVERIASRVPAEPATT